MTVQELHDHIQQLRDLSGLDLILTGPTMNQHQIHIGNEAITSPGTPNQVRRDLGQWCLGYAHCNHQIAAMLLHKGLSNQPSHVVIDISEDETIVHSDTPGIVVLTIDRRLPAIVETRQPRPLKGLPDDLAPTVVEVLSWNGVNIKETG